MTITHHCPACKALSDEELIHLASDLNTQDNMREAMYGTCGRTIMIAHLLNIVALVEQINADPEVEEKYSVADLIAKAEEIKPRLEALIRSRMN